MSNINTGTRNKRLIQEQITQLLPQTLPRTIADAADYLAYYTDLTPRCVKENYLNPMIAVGLIRKQGQTLTLNGEHPPKPEVVPPDEVKKMLKEKFAEDEPQQN